MAALSLGAGRINKYVVALALVAVLAGSIYLTKFYTGAPIIVLDSSVQQAFLVMPYFFVGALLYVARECIEIRLDVAIALIFGLFALEGPTLAWTLPTRT